MEQLQVHSKSYIVRWINVSAGHSISWSLQPHKKSLNFGIFKHPGTKGGSALNLPTGSSFEPPSTPSAEHESTRAKRGSISKPQETSVTEKLEHIGLKCVAWVGKCEADKPSTGKYDVPEGGGGMYGLVFDNTFSKQVAKTATFVLMTHPTSATPKSGSLQHYSQGASTSSCSITNGSPSLGAVSPSLNSSRNDASPPLSTLKLPKQSSGSSFGHDFHTGVMYKKRRKKNQGWARRFFSLDYTSSTLSYYRNNHSSALRGAIPLSLAAIGINEKNREFSIDSGAEIWHLRLRQQKDFDLWRDALERASRSPIAAPSPAINAKSGPAPTWPAIDPSVEREWARVEELVGRISGSRDAMRRLAQDTDPKYNAAISGLGPHHNGTPGLTPSVEENPFFQDAEGKTERLPFWKRKPSASSQGGSPSGLLRRSVSAQMAIPAPSAIPALTPPPNTLTRKASIPNYGQSDEIHERCMALLRDLDATVSEFSALVGQSKTRRRPPLAQSSSRMSIDSVNSADFFDAEEDQPQMLKIRDSDEITDDKDGFESDADSNTSSDAGDRAPSVSPPSGPDSSVFPARMKVIAPEQITPVKRRSTVPPPKQPPPSIIGFLRKNAGKDLSTVSMPVSANEPTSLLQRLAEPLEAAHLLSKASSTSLQPPDKILERLIYVSAFAISSFSSNRVKERAIRKPFNPMLGETFEFLQSESDSSNAPAYRFLAEKVSHHPVIMAWQADSLSGGWSIAQTPQPMQKFWGKSVELNTEGKWRLSLHEAQTGTNAPGEHYTWSQATCFLRNVLAGEKYTEPVQSTTIINETTGHKAVATFKASGMFSGRSEDVTVSFYAPGSSTAFPVTLVGKWTSGLTRTDTNASVWEPGQLVPDAAKTYGFPLFTAGLNEITSIEQGKLPPTDSRLRPDQQALEDGQLDNAEALKARLEERQRARRKVLESHGRDYKAKFFDVVVGAAAEEAPTWKLKAGKDGYWERRERGDWLGVEEVFET